MNTGVDKGEKLRVPRQAVFFFFRFIAGLYLSLFLPQSGFQFGPENSPAFHKAVSRCGCSSRTERTDSLRFIAASERARH